MNLELSEFKNLNVNKKHNKTKFENLIHNDYNKFFNVKKKKKKMKWRNVSKFLLIIPVILINLYL
jgi:hypothetical protein